LDGIEKQLPLFTVFPTKPFQRHWPELEEGWKVSLSLPEDDSCSKCGHKSFDGLPHFVCPAECGVCDCIYLDDECPDCWAWETYNMMTDDQKMSLKEIFDQ
jgi:hypothetical protein